MSSSLWLIVASMLATVAGVVVHKIIESIVGQQAKDALDKERARVRSEYTSMRKQLQAKIDELEARVEQLQDENNALLRETSKLEMEYTLCKQQFAWLHKCNPALFANCPNFGFFDNE